jgi:hypothetical protein
MRLAATFAAVALFAAVVRAQEAPRLRNITIERSDVFSDADADVNLFFGLANLLHFVTREPVIAREVWHRPGDRITDDEVDELARNLRGTGLFGAADAQLRRVGDDQADLVLTTRDRFSLQASASVARVGGVDKVSFRLSDGNLLGTGKGVAAASSHSGDERRDLLRYDDQQFLGTWHQLTLETGTTDEGAFTNVNLIRPFHRLEDPWSYGAEFADATDRVDYYRLGVKTASVPEQRDSLHLFGAGGSGPRELRQALGLDLRHARRDYDPAIGPDAGRVRVPGDTQEVEFGPYLTLDWRPRFQKVQDLDTLDYDQDLELGLHGGVRLAARYRDEAGAGTALQPVLDLESHAAMTPAAANWVTLAADVTGRLDDTALVGWRLSGALHAFNQALPCQTLAGSLTFDAAYERQDLAPQLTLGEDNGLRGYPAREFAGTHFARLNLEDRVDVGLEILSVRIGGAAFFDTGWIDDRDAGIGFGTALRGVGCGLRFGSSHLLGSRVMRVDVAWPLDQVAGQHYGVSVSFTVGQVFSFFGNASVLAKEF